MTISYRSIASTLLFIAVTISALFRLYRASLGTPYAVDRFGLGSTVAYAILLGVAAAVRTDRPWAWWGVGTLLLLNLVYGVAGYYPQIHAARGLDVLDWLEGAVYTGLLLAVLGCTVLRLSRVTVSPTVPASRTTASR